MSGGQSSSSDKSFPMLIYRNGLFGANSESEVQQYSQVVQSLENLRRQIKTIEQTTLHIDLTLQGANERAVLPGKKMITDFREQLVMALDSIYGISAEAKRIAEEREANRQTTNRVLYVTCFIMVFFQILSFLYLLFGRA